MADKPHTESTQNAQSGCRADLEHKHNNSKSMTPFEFVSLIVSGFTLVLVGVTATVYYYQLREMQKSTEVANNAVKAANDSIALSGDTAKRQLRAYLGVVSIGIGEPGSAQAKPTLVMNLKNFGQTPARDVEIHLSIWRMPKKEEDRFTPLPAGFIYPRITPSETALNETVFSRDYFDPGQDKTTQTIIPDDTPILNPQFIRVVTVYVYGEIIYTDTYNKTHVREFCYAYFPSNPPAGRFLSTEAHNREREE